MKGTKQLTDSELIALHKNCILHTADASCLECPYRKSTTNCDSNKLNREIVKLIARMQKRIAELEEKKAKERFLHMATLPQDEVDALFNAGRFNETAVAYAKLAMRAMSQRKEIIEHLEKSMMALFDSFDAKAARTATFKD